MSAMLVTGFAGFVVLVGVLLAGGRGLDFQNRQVATVYRSSRRS